MQLQNISPEKEEKIAKYLDILYEWNEKTNLTSDNRITFFKKHVEVSLHFLELVKDFEIIFDFGSGNGIPGVIISIFYPEKKVILVENKQRKIAFLDYVVSTLKLNAETINSSIYKPNEYDFKNFCVVSKAFGNIKEIRKYLPRDVEFNLFILLTKENKIPQNSQIINSIELPDQNSKLYHLLI